MSRLVFQSNASLFIFGNRFHSYSLIFGYWLPEKAAEPEIHATSCSLIEPPPYLSNIPDISTSRMP
jgi:hypothetical protein